ncbi:hypothetical protein GOHSU_19_00480 [Gordonia hirsuta DSM 44140 = NBRC 16056]|uniref:Uncharacterized protein n=1 Tax=Gordonia hirsuta DSM 44140 = NBRC 16056 TaxID=1121927 RepID=L7LBM7_9ACTN|nr:hypothetical protein [Gordonia hirsuta]GAC57443.1 hypothetical protein GOHSU_19_00480 [Gordonia hirsuta DSM 44140 = NBRC 16056]
MKLSDQQIVTVLDRTAAIADPILDILAYSDPLNVKPRTFGRRWWDVIPTWFGDLTATALDVADWPGTAAWEALSMNQKADWWVRRIGSVTSLGAAFPAVFGVWTKKVPAGTLLGSASQALIVLAIGREYGVVRRNEQIDMLGEVLFGRAVDGSAVKHAERQKLAGTDDDASRLRAVLKGLWEIGTGLYGLDRALGARPQSPSFLQHMAWLPVIGGPATYVGERVALRRAFDTAREWIVAHPGAIGL